MRRDPVADEPAEELAPNAEAAASFDDGARRLALRRRGVDGSLTGDHEGCAAGAVVEAGRIEHELRSRGELGAERRESRPEPAAGAGALDVAVGNERRVVGEAPLELAHRLRRRPLLRAEHARGAPLAEQRVADVARDANLYVTESGADD